MYIVFDEVIKVLEVDVVYVKLMYVGVVNVLIKFVGEVLGIIVGLSLVEVRSGLNVVVDFLEYGVIFISVNDDDLIVYYVYCVLRIGIYFLEVVGIREGEVLVYLVVLLFEVMYVLDVVMKVVDVKMCELFVFLIEINFGGVLFIGF